MMHSVSVQTDNFRVDIDEQGIAHLVFQPAGGMPVTDAQGHGELAAIWPRLDSDPRAWCAAKARRFAPAANWRWWTTCWCPSTHASA